MSVNSSFFSPPLDPVLLHSSNSTVYTSIYIAFSMTRICLFLPLAIVILHMGHRRQMQSSSKTKSLTEILTYQTAVLELLWVLGTVIYLCGIYCALPFMISAGMWMSSLVLSGETFFHMLTCMERYMAVVHPVTYLGLRNAQGVWMRGISIGCVWLLSFVWSSILTLNPLSLPIIPFCCLLVFSIIVVSFCTISVLCVLIRVGPGERRRDRKRVDQSKQRMFLTIMAITAVLLFWFVGTVVSLAVDLSPQLSDSVHSMMKTSGLWFSLPSSFVLPLLYLHREGKLPCCHYNSG